MPDPNMPRIPKNKRIHLRIVRAYLITIIVLAFLLFSQSLVLLVYQDMQARNLSNDSLLSEFAVPASGHEVIFLGIAVLMFLAILTISILLLIRVIRDMHWLELRSEFVNSVSHELKTPLSLIRLYSDTLLEGETSFNSDTRKRYMGIIARESQRLGHLIDNVLDYANIQHAEKHEERKHSLDLGLIVKQTVHDYSKYLEQYGMKVNFEMQPFLPDVFCDRLEIAQVVINLLDNARKCSDKSNQINVRLYRCEREVTLEVEDFGVGIPTDEQEKIFEPFYQIGKGRQKGGSGLGLYLVRHIMDGLGGWIEIESEVGRGSRFKLFFPIARPAKVEAEKPGKEPLQAGALE
jgi:two-component system phosphate regulon sensor histidine kinase PhoR